jgi:hypothetical protein
MYKEIIILGIIVGIIFCILLFRTLYYFFNFKPGTGLKGVIDVEIKESIQEKIKKEMDTNFFRIINTKLVQRKSHLSPIGYIQYKLVQFEYWV